MEYSVAEMSCVLNASVQCEACRAKVYEILQNIYGAYTLAMDAEEGTVEISGKVNPNAILRLFQSAEEHIEVKSLKFDGEVRETRYYHYDGYGGEDCSSYHHQLLLPPPLPLPPPPVPPCTCQTLLPQPLPPPPPPCTCQIVLPPPPVTCPMWPPPAQPPPLPPPPPCTCQIVPQLPPLPPPPSATWPMWPLPAQSTSLESTPVPLQPPEEEMLLISPKSRKKHKSCTIMKRCTIM